MLNSDAITFSNSGYLSKYDILLANLFTYFEVPNLAQPKKNTDISSYPSNSEISISSEIKW